MSALSLTIGDVSLPLRFDDGFVRGAVEEKWRGFLSPVGEEWAVEISSSPTLGILGDPLAPLSVRKEGPVLRFESPFFRGEWRGPGEGGSVVVSSDRRYLDCSLENSLRFLFSVAALPRGGVLIHAAAVIHRGLERALLFFGDSGTGKTSVSALAVSLGHLCMSDDLVMMGRRGRRPVVYSTPFRGELNHLEGGSRAVPIAGLFGLVPSKENGVVPLAGAEAVSRVVSSVPFMEGRGREAYGRLMEAVGEICRLVPVGLLRFRLEAGFMKGVENFLSGSVKNKSAD